MDPELLLKQLDIDLIKDADHLEALDEGTDKFRIFARDHTRLADGTWAGAKLAAAIEKAEGTDEEEWILNGLASSTVKDRHGDVMLPSALIDMERGANDGLTMFLNHSYAVPEDVAGTVKSAKIVSFGNEPDTGAPIYDLDYQFRVNKRNERAKDSFLSIKDGTKLGLSIGARIPEGGAIRNKKTGKLLIAHVELLETSIVGVPANPRSWVERSVEAINAAVEKSKVFALGGIEVKAIDADAEPVVVVTTPEPEPVAKAAEPDTTEPVTEPVDTAASTSPSQDAPSSTPGDDGATAAADVTAAATPLGPLPDLEKASSTELISALVLARDAVSDTTMKLIEARGELLKAEQRAKTAERERDTAIEVSAELAAKTASVLRRIGDLPVGQKASYKRIASEYKDDLDSAAEVLGEDFVATLKSFERK